MGWGVVLRENGETVEVPLHQEGSNIAVGGDSAADMTVTFNYAKLFGAAFDGLGFREALNGKVAKDVIPLLERGVEKLGDKPGENYWAATGGNAGHTLAVLLGWARLHPNAIFNVG